MNNDMNTTAAATAAAKSEVDRLRAAIAEQQAERNAIMSTITQADSDVSAAHAAYGEVLARRALDEATDADVSEAKNTLKTAEAAVTQARKRSSAAEDYKMAADCLQSRLVAAHEGLAKSQADHDKARADAAEQELRSAADQYERVAREAITALARVAGLEQHLNFDHGRVVRLLPGDWSTVYVPSAGLSAPPDFKLLQRSARSEAAEKFGTTVKGAGSFMPQQAQAAGRLASPPRFA